MQKIFIKSDFYEKIIKFLFIIFVAFLPFSVSITQITLFLLFIMLCIKLIFDKDFSFTSTSLFIPVIIYLSISILAVIFGINVQRGLHELKGLLLIVVFFLSVNLVNKKDVKLLMLILIGVSALSGLIAINQYIRNMDKINLTNYPNFRVRGNLGSIFDFAWVQTYMILIALLVLWRKNTKIIEKIYIFTSLIIMLTALILTFTRGAWLGLISGILLIPIFKNIKSIIPVLIFFMLIFLIYPQFKSRIFSIVDKNNISNKARIELWKDGIRIIKKNPILGIGIGNYSILSEKKENNGEIYPHTHNNFIQQGVDSGLLGLFSFIWIIYLLIRKGFLSIRNSKDTEYIYITIGCYACLIAFLVISIFDYNLKNDTSITLFWFLMGLMFIGKYSKDTNYN